MKYILTACLCLLAATEIHAQYDYGSPYASKGGVAPVQKRERSGERHFMIAASIESVHATSGAEIPMHGGTKYGAGIEYVFPINWNGGVGLGVHYGQEKRTLESGEFFYKCNAVDDEGDNLSYKAHARDGKEMQTINLIEIPVFYQYKAGNVFVNVGPELVIPMKAEYNTVSGQVALSGYYPKYNVELTDLPNHGFGDYDVSGDRGTLETQVTWGLNAAVGYSFPLGAVDFNVRAYIKFIMNGYYKDGDYLKYPGGVNSLSYVDGKRHLCSFGLSVGIGL